MHTLQLHRPRNSGLTVVFYIKFHVGIPVYLL